MRLIISCLLAVLLAGCTGGLPAPQRTPRSTSTAAISTSATPTAPRTGPLTTGPNVRPGEQPPQYPADARKHDVAGALDFAVYYTAVLDWSAATNDTVLLEQISASDCVACARDIEAAKQLHRNHETELGGRSRLLRARVVHGKFAISSEQVVETTTSDENIVIVSSSGQRTTVAPAVSKRVSYVFVSWRDDRWLVVGEGAPS